MIKIDPKTKAYRQKRSDDFLMQAARPMHEATRWRNHAGDLGHYEMVWKEEPKK
jgi:hypothetical protein